MAPHALSSSKRIQRTGSAVIDDLLIQYADSVHFNMAPGATYYGASQAVRHKACTLLQDSDQSVDLSKYGDVLGLKELRNFWKYIIAHGYLSQADPIDQLTVSDTMAAGCFPRHEMMITAGANQAFVNLIITITDPGDEILLILPYYFSHYNTIQMSGAVPVCIPVCHQTLLPTTDDIARRISPRSKALVIVNPGNPSGVVYPRQLMDDIKGLCNRQGIWLVLDEAYREFVSSPSNRTVYSPCADEGVIKMYTMSKVYGLAGWRVGAILYPLRLSHDIRKVQDTNVTHPSILSQRLAVEALRENPRHHVDEMTAIRRIFIRYVAKVYQQQQSLQTYVVIPDGAFYLFLPYKSPNDIDKPTEETDMLVVNTLATNWSTLVTPGFVFGMCGYIRVSFGSVRPECAEKAALNLANSLKHTISTIKSYQSPHSSHLQEQDHL